MEKVRDWPLAEQQRRVNEGRQQYLQMNGKDKLLRCEQETSEHTEQAMNLSIFSKLSKLFKKLSSRTGKLWMQ